MYTLFMHGGTVIAFEMFQTLYMIIHVQISTPHDLHEHKHCFPLGNEGRLHGGGYLY